jgi:predicted Ser/Thr protein kinase
MTCTLTEDELLSGLDREAPEIAAHLAGCPDCKSRADEFRRGVSALSSAMKPPEAPLPERIGSYVVRCRLGVGGMGVVYEAEQQVPRRVVAIKVIRGGQHVDDYKLRLFEREAQTLARLRHPNIAAIYEGGRDAEGQPFFAMELVRGQSLTEYTQRLSRHDRLELFRKVCSAINYAHQRGVIHRDIKPSNILIDTDGNPKILDFGLARITDPDGSIKTETLQLGRIMGTLAYMSPEEARGNPESIDVRSDVYSLGVVFYEVLTGELPYSLRNRGIPEAIRSICEDPPRRPGAVDRSLRGDVESIALKALEKHPDHRYQSVSAFSDDVLRFLRNEPVLARRASPAYHLRKLIARHRLMFAFALSMVGLAAAFFALVISTQSYLRAGTQFAMDLEALRSAVTDERFARVLAEAGRFDEAEGPYRRSVETFERLGRDSRAAAAMTGYATLLMERPVPEGADKASDFERAADYLWKAVGLHEELGAGARGDLLEVLEKLRTLYGPAYLNSPQDRWGLDADIAALRAAMNRSPPS